VIDTVLDRVDADPVGAMDDAATTEIFTGLGTSLAQACGLERAGEGWSSVVAYLADELTVRPNLTQAAIEGLLTGMCYPEALASLAEMGVVLTPQGQAACLGFG
jgi:hypothetical protein